MAYLITALVLAGLASLAGGALAVWFGGVWYRFLRYHRRKGLPLPDGPRWSDRIGHWLRESWALVLIHLWRLERGPPRLVPPQAGQPVVCVHGFTQDRTNFAALRRRLWLRGRPSVSLDLGLPGRHPRRLARVVIEGLEKVLAEHPDDRIDVLCHSMGGLVLRDALDQRPDLGGRLAAIVTLGSPHQGTAGARWPVRLWPEAGGLARGSAWMRGLKTLDQLAPHARTVTVAGSADYIVYPQSTCHLQGSEAVDLHGVGHAGLLTEPDAIDVVLAAIDGAPLPEREGITVRPGEPVSRAGPRTRQA